MGQQSRTYRGNLGRQGIPVGFEPFHRCSHRAQNGTVGATNTWVIGSTSRGLSAPSTRTRARYVPVGTPWVRTTTVSGGARSAATASNWYDRGLTPAGGLSSLSNREIF